MVNTAINIQIPRMDEPFVDASGQVNRSWYNYLSTLTGNNGVVGSVTGLDTDNTNPSAPIVKISVDDISIIGEGTPDSPLSSTGSVWGEITGTLSNQTDLQTALDDAGKLVGYTVATLPTGALGDIAYVTDANGPTFLTPIAGSGAVSCPVFHNGVTWVAG